MKSLLLLLFIPVASFSQDIKGKWSTIDDNTGEQKSVVDIFERGGKWYGKVVKVIVKAGEDPDPVCDKCPEDDFRYNKKIIGMEILKDLEKSGKEYENGHILDPEIGKIYKCKLWVENGELKVRGFWGPFYRTQTWKKIQ
jgi:uncharacterized protein (DUF2147 family)